MSADFSCQVAVITGGAGGIGGALGAALKAAGAQVLLADLHGSDDVVACDVADPAAVEALADLAWQRFGRVDLLVNNAGISGGGGRLWKADLAAARQVFEVNFWGVWHGCAAFAPRMAAQEHPSAIFNVASENALFCAVPRAAAYIASKHAVLGLTESLREDLPPHVHAGTIIPGWVLSGLTSEGGRDVAMPAERYAEIILPQIAARERFVVSHAYNVVPMGERTEALEAAFARSAPRYDGDIEYDVRAYIARLRSEG
ncbi:SDR family oxidoreductase [Novosphingobium sp.]|jgi:NAD(P)-dependent dehydrogenase (short-subunit alcohol dehydrogenase family)|uniref:SDR family NAD(P)-dependent oxidoreductase n=1 Tax=Novosphingobium sp. TaxID=1874826 RepID=UPI0022C47F63|nr:SDR family oxidoreductase [Novosphingobium sp.]MCZ8019840.1 SDR family NAD(P)-dependent oxidoreductase [Novosphingobium sp.]MCZ8035834.1 SDR family NAD(P)-dependent oxidoreductase [Novosphingobium sp.]MCZ8052711.1 SDR family NAD(P)-dependent oxidoreductase [Novosphingobium sp.]MCZ8060815.1 SDR family NAD(P)-dependent oxidoreductase [Novosphingobium sp.]MCZ8233387.1 SDR family NAD(P)-dependent oxidoreductase [Novosphingobium sp.]